MKALWIKLFFLCVLFVAAGDANAHEFEDGFVERSVAVVVRDSVARVEYSIGLNPNTRKQLVNFWKSNGGAENGIQKDAQSDPQQYFLQLAGANLARRLEITANNEPIVPELISALASSRHHVDVTVTLEFNLPAAKAQVPIALEITDGNFLRAPTEETPNDNSAPLNIDEDVVKQRKLASDEVRTLPAPFGGGFRYAFKATGSTVLSTSNVASILIRADRHLDANLSDSELVTALKIKAEVASILSTPPPQ